MFNRFIAFFALALSLVVLSGCASTDSDKNYEKEKVSTIPWNRPASWEGQGALGGMGMGGGR